MLPMDLGREVIRTRTEYPLLSSAPGSWWHNERPERGRKSHSPRVRSSEAFRRRPSYTGSIARAGPASETLHDGGPSFIVGNRQQGVESCHSVPCFGIARGPRRERVLCWWPLVVRRAPGGSQARRGGAGKLARGRDQDRPQQQLSEAFDP